ncbi:hypothetical protein AB0D78_39410 [Streptomyces avermitilis]|uniref:hypothetical protein n=1 Tax=Streptomyces avermitilis TaxID=33903 RepID=UPI0033DAB936
MDAYRSPQPAWRREAIGVRECAEQAGEARVADAVPGGADADWRAALRTVSIADPARDVGSDSGPRAPAGIGVWLSASDA